MAKRHYTENQRVDVARQCERLVRKGFTKRSIARRLGVKYGTLTNFHFRYVGYKSAK